jgi:hypothetical protein
MSDVLTAKRLHLSQLFFCLGKKRFDNSDGANVGVLA